MSIINNEIVKYINDKFSSVDLNTNQKAEILAQYLDSPKPLEEIKKSIDERYNELVDSTKNVDNDSVDKISAYTGIDLYVKDTNTDTINVVVDMKDIDDLRNNLKTTSYYDFNKDSLNFAKDGNDYGLILKVNDNTNINVSPILFSKDETYLYEWNNNDNTFIIKSTNVNNKKDYLRVDSNGSHTTDNNVVFNLISQKHVSEMNNIDHDDMVKNSIVRYSYIAKEKNNIDISDEKINKAIERFQDKSYDEVDSLLKSSLTKNNRVKQLGFSDAMSLGVFCIGFGVFICLLALIILI